MTDEHATAGRPRRRARQLRAVTFAMLLGVFSTHCRESCPPGTRQTLDVCLANVEDGGAPCTDGLIESASECVPERLYVATVRGSDDNDGSELTPFKTYRKAMSVAVSGQIMNFEAGVYSAESGDDFTLKIPPGVTVQGLPHRGAVTFRATGSESLVFAGDGALRAVDLDNFESSLTADRGTQMLEEVRMTRSAAAVLLLGDARMTCIKCDIFYEPRETPRSEEFAILVRGNAHLVLRSSVVEHPDPETPIPCSFPHPVAIGVRDTAGIDIDRSRVSGPFSYALNSNAAGTLILRHAMFESGCYGYSVLLSGADGSAMVEIENSVFSQTVSLRQAEVGLRVRGSTFKGQTGLYLDGRTRADLGKPPGSAGEPADPGKNIFGGVQVFGLLLTGGSSEVDAHGNTWVPNVQGANGDGHYPAGKTFTAPGDEVTCDRNICIDAQVAELGDSARVRL
jgi:hypothetical protein